MEYITAEQFLEPPKEVQKVFKEYFDQECMLYSFNNVINYGTFDDILDETPLLTEGQLRKFIEDKTHKITIIEFNYDHYNIVQRIGKVYTTDQNELLKAYWQVALKVAKESVKSEQRGNKRVVR